MARRRKTLASLRRVTAETGFQDSVAEIVAKYPTGDDPTSARYQAHSFIQEQEIAALLQKRRDAEGTAQHRRLTERRRAGGKEGGGKSKKDLAAIWRERATPTYQELRARFPKDSANHLAERIQGKLSDLVEGKTTVARWVSAMDRKRRPPV